MPIFASSIVHLDIPNGGVVKKGSGSLEISAVNLHPELVYDIACHVLNQSPKEKIIFKVELKELNQMAELRLNGTAVDYHNIMKLLPGNNTMKLTKVEVEMEGEGRKKSSS